jgi:lysozyme
MTKKKKIIISVSIIAVIILLSTGYFLYQHHQNYLDMTTAIPIDEIQVQQSTVDFLKQVEGEEKTVYKDSTGKDTVGVGHLVLPEDNLSEGDEITPEQELAFLRQDTDIATQNIKTHITQGLTQNQFDAILSLVFNIGIGAFDSSTVLKDLNKYDLQNITPDEQTDISNAWLAWKNAGGKPILLTRRQKEVDIFFS